ncbi:MAG: UbiX family flavin prenyltransferase [Chloroflexota bacterium]|nr:UbiX family flavin prenyltransferase [Chloroflexota bacterium]MDE2970092.1 UbiX family flavin prenyltransferase [Chloroflexota bacterium]
MTTHDARPVIVGVTGASGAVMAVRLVDALLRRETGVAFVCSSGGRLVWADELDRSYAATVAGWQESPHFTEYAIGDLRAPIASGSYPTRGMAVVPCSMNSLSAIAHGRADNLLLRAADVCLKERRTLVITPRETPLHSGHLENMLRASQLGAVVLPPEPPFYLRPQTVDEVVDFVVDRVLVALGVEDALEDAHQYRPDRERED